jgi:cell division protease FtsH
VKFNRSLMAWVVFSGIAILLLLFAFRGLQGRAEKISADQFWTSLNNGEIAEVTLSQADNTIRGEYKPNIQGRGVNESNKFELYYNVNSSILEQRLKDAHIVYKYDQTGGWIAFLPNLLIWAFLIALLYFFVVRQLRGASGGPGFLGNFGRSRHRVNTKEHTNVTFEDVAGIQEAKDEVAEIIEFLRNPKRFQRLGARIPRGVLLVGEPGCGKTLLAKAIAGEADVPFFSISGSDFVEMFVGVGASRVRDLFKQAKDNSPCIIFLDEIDAVGRRRGAGFAGGGHDEREQTLNAILVEMDGFDTNDQVIVIAATNRMDVLDPALTRPGRFDRQIEVPLPDIKGRFDILKIYAARVKCALDVDLQRLARGTPMFSGADLAALVNEAAIAATMAGKDSIEQADLEEARDKVRWGRARKSRVIDEREKEMTAYHEAGHTLVQMLCPDADPLHKVSIIPRGGAGGATFSLPEKDRHIYTRKWCEAFISVAMAGRIAEEMIFNDVDSGAASDIAQATGLAKRMVMDWGMSGKLGFVRYAADPASQMLPELASREYSEKTAELIDTEVKSIMDVAETRTRQIIEANRANLEAVAKALLKYETLDVAEVNRILEGRPLDKPTVGDLLEAEQAKRSGTPTTKPSSRPETGPGLGAVPQPG